MKSPVTTADIDAAWASIDETDASSHPCPSCASGHHGFHDSGRGSPSSMCGCWCVNGVDEPPLLISFTVDIELEEDFCVAWIPALNVRAIGRTPEEARQNAREVADAVLREREALARNVRLAEINPAGFAREVERLSAEEDQSLVCDYIFDVVKELLDRGREDVVDFSLVALDPSKMSDDAIVALIAAIGPEGAAYNRFVQDAKRYLTKTRGAEEADELLRGLA